MTRHGATVADHEQAVAHIIRRVFGEQAREIRRMTAGMANEVYAARLSSRAVIVRLNADSDSMRGAEEHIALFRSLGISVPEVLAADYSKTLVPFAYQIQSKLDGTDLGQVIDSLTGAQLKAIAGEIAWIVRRLEPLPTNGKFGWTGGGKAAAFATWLDVLRNMRAQIAERTATTRVVGDRYLQAIDALLDTHRPHLSCVASTFYYDDMSSKNVLIHEGRFVGLVDLDTVAYGDPLEGVGRIEASWFGTSYGRAYTDAVMAELELTTAERMMVHVYAILNRLYWLSERGIKFNGNTSTVIDHDLVARDQAIIDEMIVQLGLG